MNATPLRRPLLQVNVRLPSKQLRTQMQAITVLGATLGLPGTATLLQFGPTPTRRDEIRAGIAATVVRPAGSPPWPTLIFMNGATRDGRTHPLVLRLGLALARIGRLVFIPDLPGIADGELSPATLAGAVAFSEAAADAPEAAGGRVALAGVSVGGSLALLTSSDARLAQRVSTVGCVAPYSDLVKVMLLATTGTYRDGDRAVPYSAPPYLRLGLARSLAAMLPPTQAAVGLCAELRTLDPISASTHELPHGSFRAAGEDGERLYELLQNTDPERFDQLYDALPASIRKTAETLSPLHAAARLPDSVEIATAPRDTYFPVAESRALAAAAPQLRLTVTSLLAHATPRLDRRYLPELAKLNGFFVRSLAACTDVVSKA